MEREIQAIEGHSGESLDNTANIKDILSLGWRPKRDLDKYLKGKLNGHAVRVPLLNGSLTDAVFELNNAVTEEQVNNEFKKASETYLEGILGYEERPLVSADYVNDSRSSIVDSLSTMVVNSNLLKIYAWYDNEWGYSCRLADLTEYVIKKEI